MHDTKAHEREAACLLLAQLGDLSHTTVTLDALHACRPVFEQAAQQQASLLVTVKNNAKDLRQELIQAFEAGPVSARASSDNQGHGRLERRRIECIPFTSSQDQWQDVHWALRVTRIRCTVRKKRIVKRCREVVYAVSTHPPDEMPTPQTFLEWVRGHWSIENRLHHRKDRTLMEDRSRLKNSSARLMAAARTFVTATIGALGGYMPNHRIRLAQDKRALLGIVLSKSLDKWVLQTMR